MSFLSQNKLVVIVGLLVVVGIGWYMLSGSSAPAPTLTTTSAQGTSKADSDLVSSLLSLRAVKLDGTIFSDPAFVNLKDFSTQIVPEPIGRTDPFAPLSAPPSTSASSTHSAQIFSPR
jgi:hypothetical protein